MVSLNFLPQEPWCTDCGDWDWDNCCVKCGKSICRDCTATCRYCFYMKKPWLYCKSCAGGHELSRGMTGGCVNEWRSYARDHEAVAQIREEAYKKQGWIPKEWDRKRARQEMQ